MYQTNLRRIRPIVPDTPRRQQPTTNSNRRLELFGPNHNRIGQHTSEFHSRLEHINSSLNNLKSGQDHIGDSVEDIKNGVIKIQYKQDRIGNKIDDFKKRTLAGIESLTDRGGSWVVNCFPPKDFMYFISCIINLLLFFAQIYIFFALTWFNICNSLIGISGVIGATSPVYSNSSRSICQICMFLCMLWMSMFVMTIFSFNYISGEDQIVYIISTSRQIMYFTFNQLNTQISTIRQDLTRLAVRSNLSDDYEYVMNETNRRAEEWVKHTVGNVTLNTIKGVYNPIGNYATEKSQAIYNGIGNTIGGIFGLGKSGGGKKKTHKKRKSKKEFKKRKSKKEFKKRKSKRLDRRVQNVPKVILYINNVLQEAGLFLNYMYYVIKEIEWLYTNLDTSELDRIFENFKLDGLNLDPLMDKLKNKNNEILNKLKIYAENNTKVKLDYSRLSRLIGLIKHQSSINKTNYIGGKKTNKQNKYKRRSYKLSSR